MRSGLSGCTRSLPLLPSVSLPGSGTSQKLGWRHREQAWIPPEAAASRLGTPDLKQACSSGCWGSGPQTPGLDDSRSPPSGSRELLPHHPGSSMRHRSSQVTSNPSSGNKHPLPGRRFLGERGGPISWHWGSLPSWFLCSDPFACRSSVLSRRHYHTGPSGYI